MRLRTVTRDSVLAATYSYDQNGNRLSKVGPGGSAAGVYDDQDRMTSYGAGSYTYGANGELRTKVVGTDTTKYTYDALGNLTRVLLPDGTDIEYVIDAQNRRVGKKVNGTQVKGWLYQGQLTPVAELDGTGTVVSRFVYATGINVPDYVVQGDSTYRLIRDHLGSVRLVVNVQSGSVAQRIDYDEFGVESQNTNPGFQPFGFAGGLAEPQTGLVRLGARDYEPSSGRWTAKDPSGFGGGSANLYVYAVNDPLNLVDFTGYSAVSAIKSFAVGVVTGFVGAAVIAGAAIVVGAVSPFAVAVGAVALAAYGGWQISISGQRILLGADPWTGCLLSAEERIDELAFLGGSALGGGAFGRAAGFRGPEYGKWKENGVWQEGTHYHMGESNGLSKHHLPQQAGRWLKNFTAVVTRMLD